MKRQTSLKFHETTSCRLHHDHETKKWLQNRWFWGFLGGSLGHPKRIKTVQFWALEAFSLKNPKKSQKWPPKWLPRGPPKVAKFAPKGPQEGPKRVPRGLRPFMPCKVAFFIKFNGKSEKFCHHSSSSVIICHQILYVTWDPSRGTNNGWWESMQRNSDKESLHFLYF